MHITGRSAPLHLIAALLMLCGWPAAAWAQETVAKAVHDHSQHPVCRELDVTLDVLLVCTPETVVLLRSDFLRRGVGVWEGHGVKLFVNGKRVHVDPDVPADSYEWVLDMSRWPAAAYHVVINVCDHHDHIGVASLFLEPGKIRPATELGQAPRGSCWGHSGDFVIDGAYVGCCGSDGMWPDGAKATTSVQATGG